MCCTSICWDNMLILFVFPDCICDSLCVSPAPPTQPASPGGWIETPSHPGFFWDPSIAKNNVLWLYDHLFKSATMWLSTRSPQLSLQLPQGNEGSIGA